MRARSDKTTTKSILRGLALAFGLLAVLAYLLYPNFVPHRYRGPLTTCKYNLKNIGTGLEMYSTDWNGHYPRNLGMLTPNYLKTIPTCPNPQRVTYRADFGPKAPGNTANFEDYYTIECTGLNHDDVSVPPDYPRYNGIEGLIDRP